jgi:hypothetical protein
MQQLKLSTMFKVPAEGLGNLGKETATKLSGVTAVERVPPLDVFMVAERIQARWKDLHQSHCARDQASAVYFA